MPEISHWNHGQVVAETAEWTGAVARFSREPDPAACTTDLDVAENR